MGNSQSASISTQSRIKQKKIQHSHLGQIQHLEHPTYGECLLKIQHFADTLMTQQKVRKLNTRIKKYSKNNYILQLKGVQLYQKQQMCAHNSDLHLFLENYSFTLQQMINDKLKNKKNCSEIQILQFLRRTVAALIYLQDNGFKNCHLDKQSVIIVGENIKIIDTGLSCHTPYQRFLDGEKVQGLYIAPQLLKDMKEKNYQPFLSPKSDVFSLGMLALELACLQPLDSYYELHHKFSIDYDSLIHRVSKIFYSIDLKTLIAGMLQYEPDLRLGLITLQQKLNKLLNINQQDNPQTTKRSRSSSTKMLKQMLSQSRRSSSKCSHQQKALVRKNSSTSLTSLASLNSRPSFKSTLNSINHPSNQYKNTAPNSNTNNNKGKVAELNDPSYLKNIVKAKTSWKPQLKIQQSSNSNKQSTVMNNYSNSRFGSEFNKQNQQRVNNLSIYQQSSSYLNNLRNLHDVKQSKRTSWGSRPFFSQYPFEQHTSTTPKICDFSKPQEKVPSSSIFRQIQQDYRSGASQKTQNENIQVKAYEEEMPSYKRITGLSDAKQTTSFNHKIQTPTSQLDNLTSFTSKQLIQKQSLQPKESVSLRVKKSLDNMYKTTKSINSSEQKQLSKRKFSNIKELPTQLTFSNGCKYRGKVNQDKVMEGNGILYSPNNEIIYSGSWFEGVFQGFGELYNMNVEPSDANIYDLDKNSNNWLKFEGEFINGQRHGFGTIFYSRGQKFTGQMKEDKANGCGCFFDQTNKMTNGRWVNNRYHN